LELSRFKKKSHKSAGVRWKDVFYQALCTSGRRNIIDNPAFSRLGLGAPRGEPASFGSGFYSVNRSENMRKSISEPSIPALAVIRILNVPSVARQISSWLWGYPALAFLPFH